MQLLIDGCEILAPETGDCLGPVIDRALTESKSEPRVASRVWIDGVELDESQLEALPQRSAHSVGRVEVRTQAVAEVAQRAVEGTREYSVRIQTALRVAADHYRGGDTERGGVALAECLDALFVVVETLRNAAAFLGGADTVAALETALAPSLHSLESLQDAGDAIAIADLIEFELAEALAGWPEKLSPLLDTAREA